MATTHTVDICITITLADDSCIISCPQDIVHAYCEADVLDHLTNKSDLNSVGITGNKYLVGIFFIEIVLEGLDGPL
jgi:hypothetical protein